MTISRRKGKKDFNTNTQTAVDALTAMERKHRKTELTKQVLRDLISGTETSKNVPTKSANLFAKKSLIPCLKSHDAGRPHAEYAAAAGSSQNFFRRQNGELTLQGNAAAPHKNMRLRQTLSPSQSRELLFGA